MNVYDFDKTIYNGDSSIDFYIFCLKKQKKIIFLLPKQILAFFLYKTKIKDKIYFKQIYFSFLKYVSNVDEMIEEFWNENFYKFTNWYLKQKKSNDVIISASPAFLLNPLEKKLNIAKVIATDVDKKSGKFLSKNCYGNEKITFFKRYYSLSKIEKFYSDSLSDIYMLRKAKNGYIVNNRKNEIILIDKILTSYNKLDIKNKKLYDKIRKKEVK